MSDIEIEGQTLITGIEKIQEYSIFRDLSYEETHRMAGICTLINKNDGETIIEENSIGRGLYLLIKGKAKVVKGSGESKKTLAELGPGEIFGEMSLIDDILTSSGVFAVGEAQLLGIDKLKLDELMVGNDGLAVKIYRSFCFVLAERLRIANQKLKEACPDG